jgi:hypothetical protein
MKRFISRLSVVLLTFAFGVAATVTSVYYNPPVESYEEAVFDDLPVVAYCDLKNNPRKYNGKILRVNARLNWFMHGYFLADANCSGEGDDARAAITFYKPKNEEFYKYLEQFREGGKLWEPLKIIAAGRFKYEKPQGLSDGIEDRTSLHFEIYKIESAAR